MYVLYQYKIHNISLRKAMKMADFGTSSAKSKHAHEKATRPAYFLLPQIIHARAIRPCHPSHSIPLALIGPPPKGGVRVCVCMLFVSSNFEPVCLKTTC